MIIIAGGCPIPPDVRGLVEIPSSIVAIPAQWFYGCDKMITLVIPKSVKTIGSRATQGCTSLANVSYFHGTTVGLQAFNESGYHGTEGGTSISVIGLS